MDALARYVHPAYGLRFSPYAYILEEHLLFSAIQVEGLLENETIYEWGFADGTGRPIRLTFQGYLKHFVYDVDFASAEQVFYNQPTQHGNFRNNSLEFYRDSIVVEYYFPGFKPESKGMDWRALRLVYLQEGEIWYLVCIAHDEWTI